MTTGLLGDMDEDDAHDSWEPWLVDGQFSDNSVSFAAGLVHIESDVRVHLSCLVGHLNGIKNALALTHVQNRRATSSPLELRDIFARTFCYSVVRSQESWGEIAGDQHFELPRMTSETY